MARVERPTNVEFEMVSNEITNLESNSIITFLYLIFYIMDSHWCIAHYSAEYVIIN